VAECLGVTEIAKEQDENNGKGGERGRAYIVP